MEDFRPGDFVRLKDIVKWNTRRILNRTINVFEIIEIGGKYLKIKNSDDHIPLDEIEPLPIDGISDKDIYYDPIIAAGIVQEGHPIPTRRKDETYYYEKFGQCFYQSKSFQELVEEWQCNYVHEVQHLLSDQFHDRGLKINAL